MRAAPDHPATVDRLPDFCSPAIVFALLLVAALTVAVMALTPGTSLTLREYAMATLLAVWLAMVIAVALCKLRATLLRLPGMAAFAGVWLAILVMVGLASVLVGWLDHALAMQLTPDTVLRFVASNVTISALIGAALLRYFYVVAQWQARQAAATRAQVEALQARIRPHFLFNSMNTVAALVRVDADAAEATVENLSELFRAALGKEGPSTLGSELDLVDRYLAIEQLRLGPRLRVERRLEALPLDLPMPRLLLQPLVENAVLHGISPRRDGGSLVIRARRADEGVEISLDNPLAAGEEERGNGHGLDNVRQRLGYHFGGAARLASRIHDDRYEVSLWLPLPDASHAHPDR